MIRNLAGWLLNCWQGPLARGAMLDNATATALESGQIRARCATLEAKAQLQTAELARLTADNAFLLSAVAHYRAANQDLWSQITALGEAHATRDARTQDLLLAQAAETWGVMQARAASGRIH